MIPMARLTAALALVLALVATCTTAAAVPYPGPVAPTNPAMSRGAATQPAAAPVLLPAPGEFTPLPLGTSPHNAFPSTA